MVRTDDIDYACLYGDARDDSRVGNVQMFTAGWGSTKASWRELTFPDRLHYVDAYVQPIRNCTYIFPGAQYSYLFNDVTHVCAGFTAPVAKDTCYGDSGAPLMLHLSGQWFIYGKHGTLDLEKIK